MTFREFGVRNPFYQFRNDMDRMFGGFFRPLVEGAAGPARCGQPAVNVWEQNDTITVEMEVPGVKKEQLDLSVVGNELSVHIQRPDVEQQDVAYQRRERPVGEFTRVLPLSDQVDAEHVNAELHDGVLTITLPKAESAKPRKITVAG